MSVQLPRLPIVKMSWAERDRQAEELKTQLYNKEVNELDELQARIRTIDKDTPYRKIRDYFESKISYESVYEYHSSKRKWVYDKLNNWLSTGTEGMRKLVVGSTTISALSLSILFNMPQMIVLASSLPLIYKGIDWYNKHHQEHKYSKSCLKEINDRYMDLFKKYSIYDIRRESAEVVKDLDKEFSLKNSIYKKLDRDKLDKNSLYFLDNCSKLRKKHMSINDVHFSLLIKMIK